MIIATLLWDVDGVFVDTERLHYEAWRFMVEQFGKTLLIEEYLPLIGQGSDENMGTICRAKGIAADRKKLQEIRKEHYRELRGRGVPIITENVALLTRFAKEFPALVHVAVSSAARAYVEENLDRAGIKGIFRRVISFEDQRGMRRKPAPDIYRYALRTLGVSAGTCLAFEDSSNGVLAARAAGVACVALPNEMTAAQDFTQADIVVRSVNERTPQEVLARFVSD